MIVGVIGKVGSGKSLCAEYMKEKYDAKVFSCDDIAKELIEKGEVDYKKCRPYDFFTNKDLQAECREKVHQKVFERIIENINNLENNNIKTINIENKNNISEYSKIETSNLYVIESALPSEILYNICDKVINIYNSYERKLALLKENRDYIDDQVRLIYDSQDFYEKFYEMADYKIENNGTKEDLLEKINEVMNEIHITSK